MKETYNGTVPYAAPRIMLDEVGIECGFATSTSVGASTEGFDVSNESWTW